MPAQKIVEICCGSYYDCLAAHKGGAKRVELNSALYMNGLTPSLGSLQLTKENTGLKVISMLRPRGGGFVYIDEDYRLLLRDLELLLQHGSDGIAFGCLKADRTIDERRTGEVVGRIKASGGEAVFHKAFDCVPDPFAAMEQLIDMGIDRVLTSGLAPKAPQGREMLKQLQDEFGDKIELLAGGGITAQNAGELMEYTGISQIHSSCKDWLEDATTVTDNISFAFMEGERAGQYDIVSEDNVRRLVAGVG